MARNVSRSWNPLALLGSKFAIMVAMLILVLWLGSAFALDSKSVFLPGETSNGHVLF